MIKSSQLYLYIPQKSVYTFIQHPLSFQKRKKSFQWKKTKGQHSGRGIPLPGWTHMQEMLYTVDRIFFFWCDDELMTHSNQLQYPVQEQSLGWTEDNLEIQQLNDDFHLFGHR